MGRAGCWGAGPAVGPTLINQKSNRVAALPRLLMQEVGGGGLAIKATLSRSAVSHCLARAQAAKEALAGPPHG